MPARSHGQLVPSVGWQEGVLFVLFCAAGLGLWQYGDLLTGTIQVIAVGLFVIAVGLALSKVWRALLGPVLFYDLIRTARRGRYVLLRCIYALVLLVMLWAVYQQFKDVLTGSRAMGAYYIKRGVYTTARGFSGEDLQAARRAQLARFAEAFFSTFIIVQLLAVVLLTPAYTAGTIAEEKDRRTLEFLLATDLKDHEIIFSKLFACMANVGMLVLTGLPILGLMQLLGGVDPNLVLAGYAVTGLTIVSIASISILVSVNCKKARDAIVLSYLTLLAYIMVSIVGIGLVGSLRPRGWAASAEKDLLARVLEPFTAGNPFIMLTRLMDAWNAGTPLTSILPGLVKSYATFHGIVAFFSIAFAILRVRKTALATPPPKPLKLNRMAWRWQRPTISISREPMVWKEVFAEPGMAFTWFGKAIVLVIVLVSFVYPAWILCEEIFGHTHLWQRQRLSAEINTWVRLVGTTVACLTLLGVAVRAAGCVSGERDRQTLDNLLTTPLELRTILYAKWLGSILSVRAAWVWLGFVWILGVVLGGLDIVTLPWLLLMWIVYAAFFALLGQRFSITSSTTLRATLATLALSAVLTLGHWVPLSFWAFNTRGGGTDFIVFQAFGLTPPLALGWFAFHGNDVAGRGSGLPFGGDPMAILIGIVRGLVLWGTAAAYLWHTNQAKFATLAGRRQSHMPHPRLDMDERWGP